MDKQPEKRKELRRFHPRAKETATSVPKEENTAVEKQLP